MDSTNIAHLTELHCESYDDVNYKSVELGMIFLKIPILSKMEFGWKSYYHSGDVISISVK